MLEDKLLKHLLVVHGPNLNLLGEREPEIYGSITLISMNEEIKKFSRFRGFKVRFYQSNHEGAIIDFIHDNRKWADAMVINPGALTHYSYAIRDAIAGTEIPTVEVHLSDINKIEDFRKISVIESVCIKQIGGLGKKSYFEGIDFLVGYLKNIK